ncbi:hypothetical protein SELMODRAFT_408669 [Selaginella moellendorffii]|uniref:Uncharacterized protein n=1 Tax=Selaginella moellendorffii TaxID=88036 RepID=D8R9K2_SELML|nr:uncharacterized protein LOC9630850 [Selaginella moellendorffii]EFJ30910.1 hypothetical protein SELMODRAFT_408669 [Selaginella moellendorffii]|eukprot:XP_002967563.1 uncharacterized protein LOC9630850 [Selaginella moellendorffii]
MAQAENVGSSSFCNWLHPSLTGILFSLLLPTATLLLLLAHSCHGSDDEHFYLDLPSREGFACPEVNSFVNEFDPFYRWSLRSSLASVLSTTSRIDIELANSAYQQASAWRVISNWTSDEGANKLYASADPHIAGGHMKQHRRNWQWRMRVDWGISIRMCLSTGNDHSNRSCLWTTPILQMEREADLSLLFIAVPYRAATAPSIEPDLNNMPRSTSGFYLSNYASNARTDFTKYQKINTSSHYYLTNTKDVPKCRFAPSYYSNDATAYLGFPSLQCGCSNSSTRVCVVVTRNMDTSSWGLFDYRSSCDLLTSYWAWNTGGNTWLVLTVHNTSSDKPLPFLATFKGNTSFGSSLTWVTANDFQAMANTTVCVEALMQQTPVPSSVEVQNRCSTDQLVLSTQDGEYYLNKMRRFLWAPTPPQNKISTPCFGDLPMGQLEFKDKLCVTKLDTTTSTEIKLMVESMLQLRDVKFKQKKLWNDGSNNRHEVYGGILSAIVSFVGTCFLATSNKLQDIEESFEKFWHHGGAVGDSNTDGQAAQSSKGSVFSSQDPIFWFKFLYRTLLVLAFAVLLSYTAYSSVQSVKKDRDILQAQTVPQVLSDGTVVLLTTTATYEVKPLWASFYVISVLTALAVIITLVVTWRQLKTLPAKESSEME